MASDVSPDFFAILEILSRHEVEFVLVGGLCAVIHGAPVVTTDIDIVQLRTQDNIRKLLTALEELDAVFRLHPHRIKPNESHLSGQGHQLLRTNAGNLDVLGTIDQGRGFQELLEHSGLFEIEGFKYRILELQELIAIKTRAGRDKDIAALPALKSTLRKLQNQDV